MKSCKILLNAYGVRALSRIQPENYHFIGIYLSSSIKPLFNLILAKNDCLKNANKYLTEILSFNLQGNFGIFCGFCLVEYANKSQIFSIVVVLFVEMVMLVIVMNQMKMKYGYHSIWNHRH